MLHRHILRTPFRNSLSLNLYLFVTLLPFYLSCSHPNISSHLCSTARSSPKDCNAALVQRTRGSHVDPSPESLSHLESLGSRWLEYITYMTFQSPRITGSTNHLGEKLALSCYRCLCLWAISTYRGEECAQKQMYEDPRKQRKNKSVAYLKRKSFYNDLAPQLKFQK